MDMDMEFEHSRIVSPGETPLDSDPELTLRPKSLDEYLGQTKIKESLSIFIGPECGFSDGEVELAMQSGVKPVTLGKRILRTETAGMFVMAAVGLLLES